MLQRGMYVRCAIEDEVYPRDFALGRIKSINEFTELASIEFFDVNGISVFYEKPENGDYAISKLSHLKIRVGAKVFYCKEEYEVKAYKMNSEDGYYYYYLMSENNDIKLVSEKEIVVSYNDGYVFPMEQLRNYEFQNPMWYFGRCIVSKTTHIIRNSLYGFSEIAGCKIYLKTHQLRTIMRCLQDGNCRNMIADEVGMGKTIEALAILKVFLTDHHNTNILILVPDTLVEQWRTELAFKFKILEGYDVNGNYILLRGMEDISDVECFLKYDFVIADEVHKFLDDSKAYKLLLSISKKAENILMLSATPVQKRKDEYQKLLSLIQPTKYENMPKEQFEQILNQQNNIVRRVHSALECLDCYIEEIEDSNNEHTEDTEDAFEDLLDSMKRINKIIDNDIYSQMCTEINYEDDDFSVEKIQTALAFVCENYQFEKSIIRNRRSDNENDELNERQLETISYDIQTNFNNAEYLVYKYLSDWFEQMDLKYEQFSALYKNLISSFFSSASAFKNELVKTSIFVEIPDELMAAANKWKEEESVNVEHISEYLEDPSEYESRMVNIVDYIDQEAYGKKVLIFTSYTHTFEVYKKVLSNYFGEEHCAFFSKDMDMDIRELNAYRFETDASYWILLSDESGGEGRNFQNADILVHIDIPWSANALEQRIGRLDRIGRESGKAVLSVVCYAALSLEEDLFKVWNDGLHIFKKSQSGLEIIMNDIDEKIIRAVCSDFKYGLNNVINEIITELDELNEIVKRERYFDLAEYKYKTVNQIMENTRELYEKNERQLFGSAMMGWSALSGFHGTKVAEDIVKFDASSFSLKSASNSLFVPPDIKALISNDINQIQNKVRAMNCDRVVHSDNNYIQGTFDRKEAIENDYIHFFAPGDEIFDCIVNNALGSYKGTCAAFACKTDIDWTGLVFNWMLYPDERILLENGLSVHVIDKYRGFMPAEQIQCASSFRVNDKYREEDVLRTFNNIVNAEQNVRKECQHLGSRKKVNNRIIGGEGASIEFFMESYPKEKWQQMVDTAYKKTTESAKKKILPKLKKQLELLNRELSNGASAKKAASLYYGVMDKKDEIHEINETIYQCFKNPRLVLDSVCYVRMIKNE